MHSYKACLRAYVCARVRACGNVCVQYSQTCCLQNLGLVEPSSRKVLRVVHVELTNRRKRQSPDVTYLLAELLQAANTDVLLERFDTIRGVKHAVRQRTLKRRDLASYLHLCFAGRLH